VPPGPTPAAFASRMRARSCSAMYPSGHGGISAHWQDREQSLRVSRSAEPPCSARRWRRQTKAKCKLRRQRHELDFAAVRSVASILSPAYSYFTQPCLCSYCIDIGTLARLLLLTGHGVLLATDTMFLPLSTKRNELLRPLRDLSMRATNTQHPALPAKSCHSR
jgi:hypothetical protein